MPDPATNKDPVSPTRPERSVVPQVPDHEMIRRIGGGSYGEVWLARRVMGTYRAVKIGYRDSFDNERPYLREFTGIQKFEPISLSHESQGDILHGCKWEGYFYYVMELADDAAEPRVESENELRGQTVESTPELRVEGKSETTPSEASQPSTQTSLNFGDSYVPRTLGRELYQRGKLPFEQCLKISLSLTTGLQHLHKNGLVHRDIKPSNIISVHD